MVVVEEQFHFSDKKTTKVILLLNHHLDQIGPTLPKKLIWKKKYTKL